MSSVDSQKWMIGGRVSPFCSTWIRMQAPTTKAALKAKDDDQHDLKFEIWSMTKDLL